MLNPFTKARFIKVDYLPDAGYILRIITEGMDIAFPTGVEATVIVNLMAINGVRHFDMTTRLVDDVAAFAAFRRAAVLKGVI